MMVLGKSNKKGLEHAQSWWLYEGIGATRSMLHIWRSCIETQNKGIASKVAADSFVLSRPTKEGYVGTMAWGADDVSGNAA
ncbi:hypothetical protein ACLB2K_041582 [Fragaria x ananassa]